MGWAVGRSAGHVMAAVSVGIAAGAASMGSALASPGSMDILVWSLSAGLSSPLFAQCCKVIRAITCIALLSLCWALDIWVGADAEATVMEARSPCPLSLAFWYCSHLD